MKTTCGKCVPIETHRKLEQNWYLMGGLCVVLLALVAVTGVLALEWRSELSTVRRQLDTATETIIAKDLADQKLARLRGGKHAR